MTENVTEQVFEEERAYAEGVTDRLIEVIKEENLLRKEREEKVLDDRAYFIDYFREMHKDERESWLQDEHNNLKVYDSSVRTLDKYAKLLANPYFGKIVFRESNGKKVKKCYIGISSLMKDYETLVCDWRAPISELYYESEPGPAEYTAPAGKKTGTLEQKRRFAFEEGNLKTVQDIKMPSDDDFLCSILSENSSDYLKVIISSLQKDQNKIVRDYIDGVHVIAGCAGSGKSSVAMHKIAYIMYCFRDQLKEHDVMVLSPNDAFSAYISHVLPDLGEENVISMTQEEMILDIVRDLGLEFSKRDNSMERMFLCEDDTLSNNVKFKNSSLFKKIIDRYCKWFASRCFHAEDIEYILEGTGAQRIKKEDVDFLFYEQYADIPVANRIDNGVLPYLKLKNHIGTEEISDEIKRQLDAMICPFDYRKIYTDLFLNREFYDSLPEDLRNACPDLTRYLITPFTWEDAVAVAYVYTLLAGDDEDGKVFYLFCDEAQDLSPIMLSIIKSRYGLAHMLFAGDLHQNVFVNSEDYAELIRGMFPGKHYKKYELNVNYRSTKQISQFATSRSGRSNEISAVREGEEPQVIRCGKEGLLGEVSKWMAQVNEMPFERCCVLTCSRSEAEAIRNDVELPLELKVKFSFLPVYLAKGLEYDAAVIINIDGKMEELDRKYGTNMFYTAATRAMHRLTVLE